jgi:hypothetical protein
VDNIVKVDESLRNLVVAAFSRRQNTAAELTRAKDKMEDLIKILDVDGDLARLIQDSGVLVKQLQEADLRLNFVMTEVQRVSGQDLSGYVVNPQDGTLFKPQPAAAPVPKKTTKKSKRKAKK